MTSWVIKGGARLAGAVLAPPDKSIFHRALILGALGEGPAELSPVAEGADNRATIAALRALGVRIDVDDRRVIVHGVGGPLGFQAPSGPIDCDNSGTTMRMLAGVIAASKITATLTGDASLRGRPMARLRVLEALGAKIAGEGDRELYAPLTITGARLTGQRIVLPIASAQVKSAVLLAGLYAEGPTTVIEPGRSRDHTERMLRQLGVTLVESTDGALTIEPIRAPWKNGAFPIAPDLSSAAFLLAAALVCRSDAVRVETGINPTRAGFLEALRGMGARWEEVPAGDRFGEPVATLAPRMSALVGATIAGEHSLRAIDEIPLLAGVAAFASGTTRIRDARELRHKESDRLAATARILEAFGIAVVEHEDGLDVTGGPLRPADVDAEGDHRIAMTAAILALAAPGTSRIRGAEAARVSFPGFAEALIALGALLHFETG
jgi:3-phosphoshikimate 1-carboxyvinyltransferase